MKEYKQVHPIPMSETDLLWKEVSEARLHILTIVANSVLLPSPDGQRECAVSLEVIEKAERFLAATEAFHEMRVKTVRKFTPEEMIGLSKMSDEESVSSYWANWQPILTAPTDGKTVRVYAPESNGLPEIECDASYHPDAGWCIDEFREPTLWKEINGRS